MLTQLKNDIASGTVQVNPWPSFSFFYGADLGCGPL